MANTFQYVKTAYSEGKNILASENFQFVEGGATLDAAAIGATTLTVGTAVARKTATGKWVKYADDTGAFPTDVDDWGILNIDVEVDGTNDVIVGEIIVKGSVYESKLDANVTTAFKDKTRQHIRYVSHI